MKTFLFIVGLLAATLLAGGIIRLRARRAAMREREAFVKGLDIETIEGEVSMQEIIDFLRSLTHKSAESKAYIKRLSAEELAPFYLTLPAGYTALMAGRDDCDGQQKFIFAKSLDRRLTESLGDETLIIID